MNGPRQTETLDGAWRIIFSANIPEVTMKRVLCTISCALILCGCGDKSADDKGELATAKAEYAELNPRPTLGSIMIDLKGAGSVAY